ncbi:TetR/AcrR family transcriptional regulator [Serinibacter arcticus]|uniref:TetR/AcrR family transcriptional regulator n=1 Tax=Serinibacter arcticus TaxID=1655435 RepID=A0A2U1ZWJ8_9MICO|nr:TetR/AcrR family transcriptional regulator [Serinibacter arcticus]PWD51367.1 TetR/AcrR family transcriptional regulator [Serinibacter arcticus]
MRPSNRMRILDAAVAVVEEQGVAAVTFDAVAAAAGLTRGGVTYHFPSREGLVTALHEHVAQQWERELEAACGSTAARATPTQRLLAYVAVNRRAASRAELQLALESGATPDLAAIWHGVTGRWLPGPDDDVPDSHRLAVIAADGLWVHEALSGIALPPERRAELADRIVALVTDAPATRAPATDA